MDCCDPLETNPESVLEPGDAASPAGPAGDHPLAEPTDGFVAHPEFRGRRAGERRHEPVRALADEPAPEDQFEVGQAEHLGVLLVVLDRSHPGGQAVLAGDGGLCGRDRAQQVVVASEGVVERKKDADAVRRFRQ